MSALSELRSGLPGEDFVRLLARIVEVTGRARGFPPPEGHTVWDHDAVFEVTSAFLVDPQTPRRFADLAVHCRDEGALGARLHATVLNFFRDRARETELGRFIRRLKDVLAGIEGVVAAGEDRWRLADAPDEPTRAGPWALEGAANRERDVVVPRWGPEATRQAPVADRDSITRLAQRVLAAAQGTVTTAELARAMAPRLGLRSPALTIELGRGVLPDAQDAGDDPAELATRSTRAREVFARLSERQRLTLANHEMSSRAIGKVLGVGHTQAALARAQALEILREELTDDSDRDAIAVEVIDMAQNWYSGRTNGDDSP